MARVDFMTTAETFSDTPNPEHHHSWALIAGQLAQAISQGHYAVGQRLPSEHALADQFGVNRHTIRRALSELGQRGWVRSAQGSGTYVEEFALDLALGKRSRHQQNLALVGLRGALQLIESKRLRANADQARALQLPARAPVLWLRVLGMAADKPVHVGERLFPAQRFPELDTMLRATGSITAALKHHGVSDYTRRDSRIAAVMPMDWVASALRQSASRPVLQVESLNVDTHGVPVEYATTWFAGDRVKLTVNHHEG